MSVNLSPKSVLEATSWKSNSVFASFCLRDVQFVFNNCQSLGPFIAARELIG